MVEKRDKVELCWPAKRRATPGTSRTHSSTFEPVERYFCTPDREKQQANELFWGDNIEVLRHLLARRGDPVDMIYIDPPFFSGGNFSIRAPGGKFHRAYKDTWQDGIAQYLEYMHDRLVLMHELLRDGGSMYVHLDWHVFHYVKVMLDEIFGYENFRNQIIWKRLTYKQTQVKAYGVLHDVILYYTKGNDYTWNDVRAGYGDDRLKKYFCWLETPAGQNVKLTRDQLEGNSPIPEGRRFALNPVINPNPNRPNLTYEFLGFTKVWKYTREKMKNYHAKGLVFQPSPGVLPQKKQYLDESSGMKLNDLFLDIGGVMGGSNERLDFDTQKPVKLLERLILVSTNPGDIVADFFSGSGTTLAAASNTGRRWIGCELARPGINTTRKRLLGRLLYRENCQDDVSVENLTPFTIERVRNPAEIAWLSDAHEYTRIVLALYSAELDDSAGFIMGRKDGKLVGVVPPGAPVTASVVIEMLNKTSEKARSAVKIDILARDWALGFDENPSTFSKQGIDVQLVQIPSTNEIMALLVGTGLRIDDLAHQKIPSTILAVVPFYTLPDVVLKREVGNGRLTLTLDGYRLNGGSHSNPRAASAEEPITVIDFVGIDWDYDGIVFSNCDGSVQSKKVPIVKREFTHQYPAEGSYVILVRVIDAYGHDSSRRGRVGVTL